MVGKVIVSLLGANTDLTDLVSSDNIYPYVINENTAIPAIVYTVDAVSPQYTKDGWAGDDVTFSVVTFSADYGTLQSIADQVRYSLEWQNGTTEGISYNWIYLIGQNEGYNITENVFLNRLTFSVFINGYS